MPSDILEIARQTFAPFADPATELKAMLAGDACQFSFTRSGTQIAGTLSRKGEALHVTLPGVGHQTVAAFLAGPQMARLDELAAVQRRVLHRREVGWIAGPARLNDAAPADADRALATATAGVSGATKIIILDAPAGMGKTALVERHALDLATEYQERRGTHLALVVSSRGRRLSRLNDAIAATLQLLRSRIMFTEVPVLVRHGLLTLVIDGFDELVDSNGYESSWSSLAELLGAINGGGVLILASRDTFFDEQQFVHRAQRDDLGGKSSLRFAFLRLLPWTISHVRRLFGEVGVDSELTDIAISSIGGGGRPLICRPFFARRIAERLLEEPDARQFTMIVETIVEGFVDREAELLFTTEDIALGRAVLGDFFEEIALEMRQQESDTIDVESLRFLLDFVLDAHDVKAETRRELVFRAGSVAFLEVAGLDQKARRGFPHEVIRDYFFGRAALKALLTGDGTTARVLSSGSISLDCAEVVRSLAESEAFSVDRHACDRLLAMARRALPGTSFANNSVAMAFAIAPALVELDEERIDARSLLLGNVTFGDCLLPAMDISGSTAAFLDMTATAAFLLLADESTVVARLRISEMTLFGDDWQALPACLEVYGEDGSLQVLRDPVQIRSELAAHCFSSADRAQSSASPAEDLLERMARKWARRFYFCEDDRVDEPAFADPRWPLVRDVLQNHGRLVEKVVPSSGSRKQLLHLKDALAIAERFHFDPKVRAEIEEIWDEVAEIP